MLELRGEKLLKAKKLLTLITQVLDNNHITYHLEGGTLLGIVRDGDLLPWDHDIDLSIDITDAKKLKSLQKHFWKKGLKLSERKYTKSYGAIKKGQTRIFKVKPIAFSFWNIFDRNYDQKAMIGDIFVKVTDSKHTYWQAKGKILRVCKSHYKGHDTVNFNGNILKTPVNYHDYLTAKYGDWKTPVKEWDCKNDEKTICA
ncbi:LicD family protein [Plebeiibacterium sediminum]|uniref:LicD family protein n=1 Tax=Plebeiibacterium sediminum TaxID=2992112 RepID=A0AAE3M6M7_9BACT|nr:LicD family protein [Plebeiobacterium sediminum]MCW3788017.1 LicD family protein [Plebeiobacterium sediminum]